jgi:hypothetical protein
VCESCEEQHEQAVEVEELKKNTVGEISEEGLKILNAIIDRRKSNLMVKILNVMKMILNVVKLTVKVMMEKLETSIMIRRMS